ncbi:ABC transporter ATP-binding protein [Lutibaculum baratangense]|uniref:Branched-chain amino acid transport ATP-binding protein LivG n=1 Tax=Lutibaculum baratangense AMV1 TaxID=631454 RepID=V4TMH0_9HYPH|nr:ABC transporter ATP-binding protein [Lutibaculum baratangense]ESR26938.1 Branched-chain amino acid transport ATP-binding protein LivG [Lutibaculum baratangense AMV1]
MAEHLLDVNQVTVRFGGLVALDRVDLHVEPGRTTAILGPNGAGKTTLFNAVAGVVHPTSGAISLDGRDITKALPSRRSRDGIARTFQITQPFVGLTVRENVMVSIVSRGVAMREARDEAAEYVSFVGLGPKMDEPARTLSTGQRKRLELARALATKPRLLLLDEVTGGVDRPSIPEILDLIRRLRDERGITIVVVEHNMEVLFGLADDAVFLNRGEVVVTGSMAEVAEHEAVRRIYLGDGDA